MNGSDVDSLGYNRKVHPFISNMGSNHPCWAGWTADLKEGMTSLDIRKIAFTLKGWATIYNRASAPHHNIQYFMLGLPSNAAALGHSSHRNGEQCFNIFKDRSVCDSIECTLRNDCEPYKEESYENTVYEKVKDDIIHTGLINQKELPTKVTVGNTTVRLLSQEEARRLLNEV
mgnify:CR=1 FL=1